MESYFVFKPDVLNGVLNYHDYPGDVIKVSCCAIYDLDGDNKMKTINMSFCLSRSFYVRSMWERIFRAIVKQIQI